MRCRMRRVTLRCPISNAAGLIPAHMRPCWKARRGCWKPESVTRPAPTLQTEYVALALRIYAAWPTVWFCFVLPRGQEDVGRPTTLPTSARRRWPAVTASTGRASRSEMWKVRRRRCGQQQKYLFPPHYILSSRTHLSLLCLLSGCSRPLISAPAHAIIACVQRVSLTPHGLPPFSKVTQFQSIVLPHRVLAGPPGQLPHLHAP